MEGICKSYKFKIKTRKTFLDSYLGDKYIILIVLLLPKKPCYRNIG